MLRNKFPNNNQQCCPGFPLSPKQCGEAIRRVRDLCLAVSFSISQPSLTPEQRLAFLFHELVLDRSRRANLYYPVYIFTVLLHCLHPRETISLNSVMGERECPLADILKDTGRIFRARIQGENFYVLDFSVGAACAPFELWAVANPGAPCRIGDRQLVR